MPYIKYEDRQHVERTLAPANTGELNYLLSCWMRDYIVSKEKSYQTLSEAISAVRNILAPDRGFSGEVYLYDKFIDVSALQYSDVESAVHDSIAEFYRRVVGPYEDEKIVENGDVYSEII